MFFIQVFGERDTLLCCWRDIRRHYPHSRIVLCFDGDHGDKGALQPIFNDPNVQVEYGERLFIVEKGGLVVDRMLRLFLDGPGGVLVKLDADTSIRRPLMNLRDSSEIYIAGRTQRDGTSIAIQGGCMILSRRACEIILQSGLLSDPSLQPPEIAWAKSKHSLFRARVLGLTSYDWVLGYIAEKLNVPIVWQPGILSCGKSLSLKFWLEYYQSSVIHPRCDMAWGLENLFGVFSLPNVERLLQGEGRAFLESSMEGRQYELRLADFDKREVPRELMVWLVNKLPRQANILARCGAKTARELSRFFNLQLLESNAMPAVDSDRQFDLVILNWRKPEKTNEFAATNPDFADFKKQLSSKSFVVVDDLQQPEQLRLMVSLLRHFPTFRLFYGSQKAAALMSTEQLNIKRTIKNTIRLIVALPPLVVREKKL